MLSKILLSILGVTFGLVFISFNASSLYNSKSILATIGFFGIFIVLNSKINMKKLLLGLMIIDMDLLIDSFIFANDDILSSVPGLHISIMTCSLIALYILWWFDIITRREKIIDFFPKSSLLALGYLISCLLSIYNSLDIWMSFFSVFFITQMFMLYFYIANHIKSKDDLIYILNILLLCLIIQSTVIIIEFIVQAQFSFTQGFSSGEALSYYRGGKTIDFFRPTGTGGDPNDAGGHIAVLLLIVMGLFFYTQNCFKKILLGIVLMMSIAALILTFSRGSWLSFTVGLVIFFFVALRHHWINAKRIVTMAVLVSIVLGLFYFPITARLSQDDRGSAYSRVPLMKLAFEMIQEHPFIGVGANNFGIVLPRYLSSESRGQWLHIVHSIYLLIFAETGLIGMGFFLMVLGNVIFTSLRCIRAKDSMLSLLSLGVISGLIALFLHMGVELAISRLTVQLFWIMLSITIASERLIRNNRRQFLNVPRPMELGP